MAGQRRARYAKKFFKELDLPNDVRAVLKHSRYWSEPFCRLYFERCDEVIFEDPLRGLEMARVAPLLAGLVPEDHLERGYGEQKELLIHGLSVLGSAYRGCGLLDRAESTYESAQDLGNALALSPGQRAELDYRFAVLRAEQRRFDEAKALLESAISTLRSIPKESRRLGTALTIRGAVHIGAMELSEAVTSLSEAIRHLDPKSHPLPYYSAIHNLSYALARGAAYPGSLNEALAHLHRARLMARTGRGSLPKLKIRWIEAIIMGRLGMGRRAERALETVREGFVALQTPLEVAIVSLDLSLLYLHDSRFDKLGPLAAETYRIFKDYAAPKEAAMALHLWREAVQQETLTQDLLSEIRGTLQSELSRSNNAR